MNTSHKVNLDLLRCILRAFMFFDKGIDELCIKRKNLLVLMYFADIHVGIYYLHRLRSDRSPDESATAVGRLYGFKHLSQPYVIGLDR